MPFLELCREIEETVAGLTTKRERDRITREFDPAWRVVCLAGCGWFNADAMTDKGRAELDKFAAELGLS